ncbi:hypothetical protein WMF04_38275 [Sorangium sp. So ce260]|uniref:hypothetical protein n=1 Tax=Sorangium sp. So ce260 TaxID=3133291 RepID=UPI003F635C25
MALILGVAAFSAGCGDDDTGSGGGTTASSSSSSSSSSGAGGDGEGGDGEGGEGEGGEGEGGDGEGGDGEGGAGEGGAGEGGAGEGGAGEGGAGEGGAGAECVTCSAPLLTEANPDDLCGPSEAKYDAITACICAECGAAAGDACYASCTAGAQPTDACTLCGTNAALTPTGACKAEGDACIADTGE